MQQLLNNDADQWRNGDEIETQMTLGWLAVGIDMVENVGSPVSVACEELGSASESPHNALYKLQEPSRKLTTFTIHSAEPSGPKQGTYNNSSRPHVGFGAIKSGSRGRNLGMGLQFWSDKSRFAFNADASSADYSSVIHELAASKVDDTRNTMNVDGHVVNIQIQMRDTLRVKVRESTHNALEDRQTLAHPLVARIAIDVRDALELGWAFTISVGKRLQMLNKELPYALTGVLDQTSIAHVFRSEVVIELVLSMLPSDHIRIAQWRVHTTDLQLCHDADLALNVVPLHYDLILVHSLKRDGCLALIGVIALEVDTREYDPTATDRELLVVAADADDAALVVPGHKRCGHLHDVRQ